MDFATVSAAVALLAILLAWYALLEYEDRRLGKNGRRPKGIPAGGRLGASRALELREREHVAPQSARPNGDRPSARPTKDAPAGRAIASLGPYGLAAAGVLVAFALVTLCDLLFSFPPFIFLAASVALAFTLAGRGPGLFALLSATLLSDFFFVEPELALSMDWRVFRLAAVYLLGGLLSAFISRRLSAKLSA